MRMSWKPEAEHLVCRWSGAKEPGRYYAQWMQQSPGPQPTRPSFLDFTRLSPFGGRRWFDPNRGYGSQ
jgi:hypothetical protein